VNDDTAHDPLERLPLTPAVLHILVVLAAGERHGYGIMQEVAEITDGRLRLGPGTLYRSLRDMLADGLIEEAAERPAPDLDDERRRYYRLTEFGQRVARAEVERLAQLVNVARTRNLLLRPRTTPHTGGN
jgi:DNA-binding PadR family transcriptional regulator